MIPVPQRKSSFLRLAAFLCVAIIASLFFRSGLASADDLPIDLYEAYVGTIDDSALGYLGCVTTADIYYDLLYCFVAYEVTSEDGVGRVSITAMAADPDSRERPTFERALVDGAALTGVDRTCCLYEPINFKATLTSTGPVDLHIRTWSVFGDNFGNEGCILYPVHYELLATEYVIAWAESVTGTVNGREVEQDTSVCGAYFIGPTSGIWTIGI